MSRKEKYGRVASIVLVVIVALVVAGTLVPRLLPQAPPDFPHEVEQCTLFYLDEEAKAEGSNPFKMYCPSTGWIEPTPFEQNQP